MKEPGTVERVQKKTEGRILAAPGEGNAAVQGAYPKAQ